MTEAAPFPEAAGYRSLAGFTKSNPKNNAHYLAQYEEDPWFPILKQTDERLENLIPGYNISQIKAKFGGLRFYITFPLGWDNTEPLIRDKAQEIISGAESWVQGYEFAKREAREAAE